MAGPARSSRPALAPGGRAEAGLNVFCYGMDSAVSLYQRILGHPFVYDHVRPLAIGGLDMSPFYSAIQARSDSVILDVGCGTGDALRYLREFGAYLGVDTDPVAIGFARERYAQRPNVTFDCRTVNAGDVKRLEPTEVVLGGILHHLPDALAKELLELSAASPRLRRIVALDIVFLPGEHVSNLLARLDRGRFCRHSQEYVRLAEGVGLRVIDARVVRSHPRTGLARYWMMTLEPRTQVAAPAPQA